ncbi:hypothetical protein [Blastococcus sp. SYSU D00695]
MCPRSRTARRPAVTGRLAGPLAGLLLLVPACSSTTTGSGTPGAGASGSPAAPTSAAGDPVDSVAAMLGLLPPMGDDELGVVTVSRWHAAAQAYGVDAPPAGTPVEELVGGYLVPLTTEQGGLVRASDLLSLDTVAVQPVEEQFGFAVGQVAADVSAGTPPRTVSAARGDFDPDAIAEATGSGPVGDEVTEEDVDGVRVLSWLDDLENDLQRPTALSATGSAGRLGLPDEQTLLLARDDDGIAALVAATQGGDSLADDADLAAVATALDGEDVLSAQMLRRPAGSELTYEAAGIGFAWDGSGHVVLAYSAASESDAQALAADVEELLTGGSTVRGSRPWSELLPDPVVRADGTVVVVTSDGTGPSARWSAFLPAGEALF